jgi:hypothetical protein
MKKWAADTIKKDSSSAGFSVPTGTTSFAGLLRMTGKQATRDAIF